jgi:NO-binding membrane sensor protein with MHYT domain
MGGISIWCMHFIGNRAMTLGDDDVRLRVSYSAGYTTISFFVPVLVLFLAFAAVGVHEKISVVRVVLGGSLAGMGVCGMHYLGQAGISNYDCIYSIAHVIGSAIVAIVASITALGTFFLFRSTWTTARWKRALCAVVLAGAVSGMHWLASTGTTYRLKLDASFQTDNSSRTATLISVIVLVSMSIRTNIICLTS